MPYTIQLPEELTRITVAAIFDHTILKASATEADVLRVTEEGLQNHVASICVNPMWVPTVRKATEGSDVEVCSVVGFPLGAGQPEVVALEATRAVHDGATEIDMVIPVGLALEGKWDKVGAHVAAVRQAIGDNLLKVILEVCELSDEQIVQASRISIEAGADYIKTSTGFSKGGATVEAVQLMAEVSKGRVGIKAAGGIKTLQDVLDMVAAGATRIGASATLSILDEIK